jgi:hypothetical protein
VQTTGGRAQTQAECATCQRELPKPETDPLGNPNHRALGAFFIAVIPAQAGTQLSNAAFVRRSWIPAFAGMTSLL